MSVLVLAIVVVVEKFNIFYFNSRWRWSLSLSKPDCHLPLVPSNYTLFMISNNHIGFHKNLIIGSNLYLERLYLVQNVPNIRWRFKHLPLWLLMKMISLTLTKLRLPSPLVPPNFISFIIYSNFISFHKNSDLGTNL